MNDEFSDIRTGLRQWKVSATLPRQFKSEVWRKIAVANRPGAWQILAEWLDAKLLRPAPALAYVAVLLMIGMGAGAWRGEHAASQQQKTLLTQYVQSVDPYQRR